MEFEMRPDPNITRGLSPGAAPPSRNTFINNK